MAPLRLVKRGGISFVLLLLLLLLPNQIVGTAPDVSGLAAYA